MSDRLAVVVRRHVLAILRRMGGDVSAAAGVLGIARRSLQRMLRRWGYEAKRGGRAGGMPRKKPRRAAPPPVAYWDAGALSAALQPRFGAGGGK
jgi:hypothetical protein